MHQVFDMWILTCSQWNEYKTISSLFSRTTDPGAHPPCREQLHLNSMKYTQIKHIFVLNKL